MNRIIFLFFLLPFSLISQEDLLNELENDVVVDNTVIAAFKGLKM